MKTTTRSSADTNWLKSARIFALESWWPPFWPHIEVDWDRALWTMKRLHLDTLQANAFTKWAFFPSEKLRPHPELGSRDLLQEAQEFCAKHDFSWIIYTLFGIAAPIETQLSKGLPQFFRPLIADRRPKSPGHRLTVPAEFQDFTTNWFFGGERYVANCVFASEPWLLEHARELADRYSYDAAWIDGSIETGSMWANDGAWNLCGCEVCQRAYWNEFRRPLPASLEVGDRRLPDLWRWTMRRTDELLGSVVSILSRNRFLPVVGNLAFGVGPACHRPEILRHLDGGLFEHAADQVELVRKLGESRHLVEVPIHYPDIYDAFPRRVTSGWEVENKGLTILAHGGKPYLAMPGKYYYDATNDAPAERVFAFMEQEADLLAQQRCYASCAVAALPWVAPASSLAVHTPCARGWIAAMLDTHLPVTAVPNHLLEEPARLADYPVVILPHVEMLSKEALLGLRSYVEAGGFAILTGDPGRLDRNLDETRGAAILEILDLAWHPLSEMPRDEQFRRCMFERELPLGHTYDLHLQRTGVEAAGFPVPGDAVCPCHFGQTAPGRGWETVLNIGATDNDRPLFPALAVKSFGEGRMLFSSVLWGRQYDERRAPALAAWMRDLVSWLPTRPAPCPIEVNGPRALQVGTTRVEDGWLLYLVNQSNDVQGRRQSWTEMMKVAERPGPIGPVRISVSGAERVRAVYGPPPQRQRVVDGCLQVHYDNFDAHVVLHAEPPPTVHGAAGQ